MPLVICSDSKLRASSTSLQVISYELTITPDVGYDPLSPANEQLFRGVWMNAEYAGLANKKPAVRPTPVLP